MEKKHIVDGYVNHVNMNGLIMCNKRKCNMEDNEKGLDLGNQHWNYIENLLKIHGEEDSVIEKIKFHYVQAMTHGYKHGLNDK